MSPVPSGGTFLEAGQPISQVLDLVLQMVDPNVLTLSLGS
jgi:hypothetical protein